MMKKIKKITSLTTCLAVLGASGCIVSPSDQRDEEQIWNMLNEKGFISAMSLLSMDDGIQGDESYQSFKRHYEEASKITRLDLTITGNSADAVIEYEFDGSFYVMYDDTTIVEKVVNGDTGSRKLLLVKNGGLGRFGGWDVDEMTVLAGSSVDERTEIEEISVSAPSTGTIHFADPAQFWERRVLTFVPGEEVTVTVRVSDTAVIPVIHRLTSENTAEHKLLEPTPEELVFSNTYTAPVTSGIYHTFLDVIDEDSVTERDAPYSAAAWGMPYWIQ